MKKYIIPVLAALLLAGCQKTVKDEGTDIDTGGYTLFNVDIEALDLGIGAPVQGVWADGARIGVFGNVAGSNAAFNLKHSDAGLSAASFYGELVVGNEITAYAPFEEGLTLDGGAIPCDLAYNQEYDAEASIEAGFVKYCPRSFAALEDGELHFRYPMGLLKVVFTFDEAVTVKSINLTATKGISGRMGVLPDGKILTSDVTRKSIALALPAAGVSSKDAQGGFTPFWFVIPPAAYAAGDLTLEITTTDEAIRVQLKELEVKRVEGKEFSVAAVEVNSSLPGFETTPGFLE